MRRLAPLLALAACAEPPPAPWPATASGTIALTADEGALYLASPDDDRVVEIDPETLTERRHVALDGGPAAVAIGPDGRLLAPLGRAAAVAVIDGEAVDRIALPCGGPAAAVWPGETAFVSCPHDDRVVQLDPRRGVVRVLAIGPRPEALATDGDRLAITVSGGLRLVARADLDALPEGPEPVEPPHEAIAFEATPGFAATAARAVVPTAAGFVAGWQRVDHDSDRDRPPEAGGYGRLVDAEPRIEPRLYGPCLARPARFDGGARVFSGLRALAVGGDALWAVHQFTDNVALIDCAAGAVRGSFRVGRGPKGVAVSADGRRAFVDVAFDHAVARLDAADARPGAVSEAAHTRRRATGPLRLDAAAQVGRQLFHDAVDTHLTPSGVVACASCHPDGGEDGIAWFLHTRSVPRKLRRTPPARADAPPLHWDGALADAAALSRDTIRGLMDGDALLVDVAAMAAWMATLPPPPGRPAFDAADAAQIAAGEAGFARAGCDGCHPGPIYADGMRHAGVVEPSADPDARMAWVDTPSLRGVRARGPWLHDGRAATLAEAVAAHREATVDDLAALVRFLESL